MFQLFPVSAYTSQGLLSISCSEEVPKKPWRNIARTADTQITQRDIPKSRLRWIVIPKLYLSLLRTESKKIKGDKITTHSPSPPPMALCLPLYPNTPTRGRNHQEQAILFFCHISSVTVPRPRRNLHEEHNPGRKAEREEKTSTCYGSLGHISKTFIRNFKGKLNIVIAAPFHQ